MGSPKEPGPQRTSEGAGSGNGSNGAHDGGPSSGAPSPGAPSSGSPSSGAPTSGDVPPWQRSAVRPAPRPRAGEGAPPDGPRGAGPSGHSPGTDARLNRFIAGGPSSGPAHGPTRDVVPGPQRDVDASTQANRPERSESGRPEVYASELPDLSGSAQRSARTKTGGERTTVATATPEPARSSGSGTRAGRSSGPVRASMQIRRLDPWSVLKVSLVLSVALFFVWMIAVAFLYLVLGGMGVWSKLNSNVGDLLTSASGSGGELVSSGTIFGGAALVGLVNIVLLTAMATCGAFIYNLTTDIVGGVEVTLADRD